MNPVYIETARLMAQIAPLVFADDTFALKGGTAINLFVRNMPRLSVDLDLVFPDHTLPREQALAHIQQAMREAADRLIRRGFSVYIPEIDAIEAKLLVRRGRIEVKVEANFVMRGTVHPVRRASFSAAARNVLLADIDIPLVALEDMYGGKLCAALDRQHPRDLFDVMQLYEHEGITPGIRRAFVVYLACSTRPIHELLYPQLRDIRYDYANNFQGMTVDAVPLEDLLATRERLLRQVQQELDADERGFLLSLVRGEPDWSLLGIPHLEQLPGIRWKLQNLLQLRKSNARKFMKQADALVSGFESAGG
jgi:predicted nucleotidyltransferase component of viral defense system